MKKETRNNLINTLKITEALKDSADEGLSGCSNDNCILLYGIIKDSCYKIKNEIAKELNRNSMLKTGKDVTLK
ncbi:MAG: hypothetical protein K9M56_04960 [Victivallales bacterium]|nr:hypothetical protein [Victivallales bacterium]